MHRTTQGPGDSETGSARRGRSGRPPSARGRAGRSPSVRAALAAFVACVALQAAPGARAARPVEPPPTRSDLDAQRRAVALLESELSLSRSRKPYLVVDAPARRLRYGLLGATLREIEAQRIAFDGLRRADGTGAPGPLAAAGIVTLREKENDPRLTPLTPEQIEAGAADENVADALPPEAPADFTLRFKQPVAVRVLGHPEKRGAVSRALAFWGGLWPGGGGRDGEVKLSLTIHLDEATAREVYRSLVPGGRLVLVPPPGFLLPEAGQEPPRGIRPGRPARPPVPPPGPAPEGVPFRIPPPVAEGSPNGSPPAADGPGPADGAPAPDEEGADPQPGGETSPPAGATPPPAGGTPAPAQPPPGAAAPPSPQDGPAGGA